VKRAVNLVIYRAMGFRPLDFIQTADAIESIWSLDGPEPFKGHDPIVFSYKWESAMEIRSDQFTRFWNGVARSLTKKGFINPDGATFQPGGMSIIPHQKGQPYYRGYITFERL